MRLLPIFFGLLFLHSSCNNSAEINLENKTEVYNALCNEWESAYFETVDSRIQVPAEQISRTVYIKDGSFTSGLKNGVIVRKGEWAYDPETKMLQISQGGQTGSIRVVKLTGKELITAEYTLFDDVIRDSLIVTYQKQ